MMRVIYDLFSLERIKSILLKHENKVKSNVDKKQFLKYENFNQNSKDKNNDSFDLFEKREFSINQWKSSNQDIHLENLYMLKRIIQT
jgi:hypothetical protein